MNNRQVALRPPSARPPDLFSTVLPWEQSSASDSPPPSNTNTTAAEATVPSRPYVLPKDLPKAIRGKLPEPDENSRKQRVEPAAVTLPSGKLNAVRAAFKAGVKPSQIARQFGISQADVRKALVTGGAKA